MCLNTGTPNNHHFPFGTNGNVVVLGVPILKYFRVFYEFQTGPITITAVTVKKARFTLDLPSHTLSFKSKVGSCTGFNSFEMVRGY